MARSCYFNPRPRKEGDSTLLTVSAVRNYFNPRPRKEGDDVGAALQLRDQFQSTPSQRGRQGNVRYSSASTTISIHALAKRATHKKLYDKLARLISIHALAKRATSRNPRRSDRHNDFNPRPRKEGDKAAFVIVIFHPHFNPRPRKEGD